MVAVNRRAAAARLVRRLRNRLRRNRLLSRAWDRRNEVKRAKRPPREVVEDKTNLGPIMDAAVARAKRTMLPAGLDADYDLAYEHFDVTHFLLQARHLLREEGRDPLKHFLSNGATAKASPEINFNMRSYLSRYPEKKSGRERSPYLEWLKRGRDAGEIADPAPGPEQMAPVLGLEPRELVNVLGETRSDLQARLRTGTLGEMFARAAEVEPLIGDVWTETTRPVIPPLASANVVQQVGAMQACHQAAGRARARLVIVVSDPRWGGGRRAEGHIAHALTGFLAPQDVVVIYTDKGGTAPPDRFPAGVREIDLAGRVEELDKPAAYRMLVELIRSFHADAVLNIASRLLYEAMTPYGKALASSERIFLMQFCNEQLATGNWVGVPLRYFYRCFDSVEGVITDSAYFATWLRDRHQLGPGMGGRVHVFKAPADPHIPVVSAPTSTPARRPQVFWAGRWDRQKRTGLAFEVARGMPDVVFRMWGESVIYRGEMGDVPDNVQLEGSYGHICELPLSDADAWLYTSGWDGVPSQLLEVAMTGIPIVASLVGGTGEVLSSEDTWPVADRENPGSYMWAIRDVLADQTRSRRRAHALRERLLRERTEPEYADHVAGVLLGDGGRAYGEAIK